MRSVFKIIWVSFLTLFVLVGNGCSDNNLHTVNPIKQMDVAQFNQVITAKEFNGLVVAFATWCAPCREELPEMAEVYRSHQTERVQIVAMSVDDGDSNKVQLMVDDMKLPFPVYHVGMQAVTQYKIVGIPTLMVIKAGRVVQKIPGQQTADGLKSKIKMLLNDNS